MSAATRNIDDSGKSLFSDNDETPSSKGNGGRNAEVTAGTNQPKPALTERARMAVHEKTEGLKRNVDDMTESFSQELNPDSHGLAHNNPAIQGAVTQTETKEIDRGVRDIGWHKDIEEIPDPLIRGIPNGTLFSFIRRFNKDVFDVRSVPMEVTRGLDLNEAWAPDYVSEKIPLQLQRLYLTWVLGIASVLKHVSRIRSWRERNRTSALCVAYTLAWLFDLLAPLFLGTLIGIISSKKARETLFPPAPRALVDMSSGGLRKPAAGHLGTHDTLTGAPEKHEGEALDQEASNFADNLRNLASRAMGMHKSDDEEGDPLEGKVPRPIRNTYRSIQGKASAAGHMGEETDPVKELMEDMLWEKLKPAKIDPILKSIPHALGGIADNWERCANAIHPTPPFSPYAFLRLDAVLVCLFLSSFFISFYMVYKTIGAGIGLVFFGDPFLGPAQQWLNDNYPNWMQLLEPKNNILRGVPTNNQIALTLLRIGEAHNTPLPPVPTSHADDQYQEKQVDVNNLPFDASRAEKLDAVESGPSIQEEEEENDGKHKHISKFVRFFKGSKKAAVEGALAVDHVRAAVGPAKAKEHAKGHLGVLAKQKNIEYAGPSEFKARYSGKPGWLYITEAAEPSLIFTNHDPRQAKAKPLEDSELTIVVKEIKRLKRATAFSNRLGEMAAASEEKKLLAGLEISTADEDQANDVYRFTAIPERDELFNRLVAIGQQRWENM